MAIIDCDPEQGEASHFWPTSRILGYAGAAGYELVRRLECPRCHLIVVIRPKA